MLERLIHFSLRQRLLTFLGALFIAAWGAVSYLKLPIDAFPDVAPVQVLAAPLPERLPPAIGAHAPATPAPHPSVIAIPSLSTSGRRDPTAIGRDPLM